MPRIKAVPVGRAKRGLPEDSLIDDTPEDVSNSLTKSARRTKSGKKVKNCYEFRVEPEFEVFLTDANLLVTIHYADSEYSSGQLSSYV